MHGKSKNYHQNTNITNLKKLNEVAMIMTPIFIMQQEVRL